MNTFFLVAVLSLYLFLQLISRFKVSGLIGGYFIGVSIDAVLWRRLRALAILEGKGTGELLDAAIREYLDKYEK
jgi:hypothetical protein